MKLIPVFTEKSTSAAKNGFFTFWVDPRMDKNQIRRAIEGAFDVHVTSVHTLNFRKGLRKNLKGQAIAQKARKKAIVTLKGDEKIALFSEKKGK
jgi:large subunit ribosomal protein L23